MGPRCYARSGFSSLAHFLQSQNKHAKLFLSPTSFHLQQRLGQHAPCHADGLTDVEARVLRVDVCDGQLAAHGDGVAAGLRGRLAGEQQHLKCTQQKGIMGRTSCNAWVWNTQEKWMYFSLLCTCINKNELDNELGRPQNFSF